MRSRIWRRGTRPTRRRCARSSRPIPTISRSARCLPKSIMNETPWNMWDLRSGKPAEGSGTEECRAVLEHAFDKIPAAWNHPGLLHLYVHLMEMSPFPQRALRAGDRLREIVPDSGHLIHMPTHIDVLCGNYHDVLVYNQKALAPDRRFLAYAERSRRLPDLRHPQLPLRDLRRDVPRPVHRRDRDGRGADRHGSRGGAAHSIATDGGFPRRLSDDEAARSRALRQMARDHRAEAARGSASSTARTWP